MRTFEQVQRLAPEIVVYTGDFTSHASDVFDHARRVFAHLALGSRATFGILGNHDYGPSWSHPEIAQRIADLAQAAGVHMLRNEKAEVNGLQVVGLDDLWARRFEPHRALAHLNRAEAALVLSHNPDTADQPGWGDYAGWILAGHTHGGQCKAPFLPPPLLPVRNRRYTAGEFALAGGRRMYINRGVGHLLRVRFNVRPEVTLFQLERA
jgi:predicted MPP superfamily phosphohydrolase